MLDIGSSEFLLIAVVAAVVIGPKDLPRALHKLGQVTGKARAMMGHVRSGVDAMVKEAELAELEKNWAAQNDHILRQHDVPLLPVQFEADGAGSDPADAERGDPSQSPGVAGNGALSLPSSEEPSPKIVPGE